MKNKNGNVGEGTAVAKGSTSVCLSTKGKPYRHQERAFEFAVKLFGAGENDDNLISRGVALFMDMGTGKTFVAIALMGYLFLLGRIKKVLVVAPLTVLGVWEEQLELFANFPYNVSVISKKGIHRSDQLKVLSGDVLQIRIINYDYILKIEKELSGYAADLIIADEGHLIKNALAKRSQVMHRLGAHAKYRLLLTGTPITNHVEDIFSEYLFLNPHIFGYSYEVFCMQYFCYYGFNFHKLYLKRSSARTFLRNMHSIAFRVTKTECLTLSGITEEVRSVRMESDAMREYRDMATKGYYDLSRENKIDNRYILAKIEKLQQITGGFLKGDDGNVRIVSRAKMEALEEILKAELGNGNKVVIIAKYNAELDAIIELLVKKKLTYAVIRGRSRNRANEVRRFQNDESCRVFVGQIKAAGNGISLTAASAMIFYSVGYSVEDFEQAKARIDRMGQIQRCRYYYLVCKGTIDVKIIHSQRVKRDIATALIDDCNQGMNPFLDDEGMETVV